MRMMIIKNSLKHFSLCTYEVHNISGKKNEIKPFGNFSLPKEFYHLLKDAGKQSQIITQTVFEVTERANN